MHRAWYSVLSCLVIFFCLMSCSSRNHASHDGGAHRTVNYVAVDAPEELQLGATPRISGGDNRVDIHTGLVQLAKFVPSVTQIGEEYLVRIVVGAVDDAANIVVTEWVPDSAQFVRSDPPVKLENGKVRWDIDFLREGQSAELKLWYVPEVIGELSGACTIVGNPAGHVSTWVAEASLKMDFTGASIAMVDGTATYQAIVRNEGKVKARGLVVRNHLPEEFIHETGRKELIFDLGDLAPGEAKDVKFTLKAVASGNPCQELSLSSANAGSTTRTLKTQVQLGMLTVERDAPEEQMVGKPVQYGFTVTNTGDVDLTGLSIQDLLPAGTKLISAEEAEVSDGSMKWHLDRLRVGESAQFRFSATSEEVGNQLQELQIKTAEGIEKAFAFETLWKGHPALVIEAIDTHDPLLIGTTTLYKVRVANKGTAKDTNVRIIADFSPHIMPLSAAGATSSTVSGQTVTFSPLEVLEAKQVLEYSIQAQAQDLGDGRIRIRMESDTLRTPVMEEESTYIY
ncbi:MAG: hypothetical protein CMO81_04475 [Waddliaceae bacterium]|nr:hypothetical protein [Waddliaceae bacterium]